mgnify:CR=1 FL=1
MKYAKKPKVDSFAKTSREGLVSMRADKTLVEGAENFHFSMKPTFHIGETMTFEEFERRTGIRI